MNCTLPLVYESKLGFAILQGVVFRIYKVILSTQSVSIVSQFGEYFARLALIAGEN